MNETIPGREVVAWRERPTGEVAWCWSQSKTRSLEKMGVLWRERKPYRTCLYNPWIDGHICAQARWFGKIGKSALSSTNQALGYLKHLVRHALSSGLEYLALRYLYNWAACPFRMRLHIGLCCATLVVGWERRYSGVSFNTFSLHFRLCSKIYKYEFLFVLCSGFFRSQYALKGSIKVRYQYCASLSKLGYSVVRINKDERPIVFRYWTQYYQSKPPCINMTNALSVFCTLHIWGARNWYPASLTLAACDSSQCDVCRSCPLRQCLSYCLDCQLMAWFHRINEGPESPSVKNGASRSLVVLSQGCRETWSRERKCTVALGLVLCQQLNSVVNKAA